MNRFNWMLPGFLLLLSVIAPLQAQDSLNVRLVNRIGDENDGETDYGTFLVVNDILYATELWNGLTIFNISDPVHPVMISNTPIPEGSIAFLSIKDYYIYANAFEHLYVFDVSDLEEPSIVGEYHGIHGELQLQRTTIEDDYLYSASFWDWEVLIFNISDRVDFHLSVECHIPSFAKNDTFVFVTGDQNPYLHFCEQLFSKISLLRGCEL